MHRDGVVDVQDGIQAKCVSAPSDSSSGVIGVVHREKFPKGRSEKGGSMIRVTIDAFSGRPNRRCLLEAAKAKGILRKIQKNPAMITSVDSGFDGLGFRGIVVEQTSDEASLAASLPPSFRIAGGASGNEKDARSVAMQVIEAVSRVEPTMALDKPLRSMLLDLASKPLPL